MFTQAELSEVRETILDIGPALTEIWPEVNYFSFSFAGVALVLPEVIKTGSQFILPDIGQPASIFWNGADAALSIGAGILMLMAVSKKLEHRRLATGFKGAVNITKIVGSMFNMGITFFFMQDHPKLESQVTIPQTVLNFFAFKIASLF